MFRFPAIPVEMMRHQKPRDNNKIWLEVRSRWRVYVIAIAGLLPADGKSPRNIITVRSKGANQNPFVFYRILNDRDHNALQDLGPRDIASVGPIRTMMARAY